MIVASIRRRGRFLEVRVGERTRGRIPILVRLDQGMKGALREARERGMEEALRLGWGGEMIIFSVAVGPPSGDGQTA